ncbi:MAG: T9SS type A sorting domain-containing protein, partial [Sphingobacteriales bacterium]
MGRVLVTLLLLLSSIRSNGQELLKNGSFELWHPIYSTPALDPDSWTTNKTYDSTNAAQLTVIRSEDCISGKYSALLVPVVIPHLTGTTITNLSLQDTLSRRPKKLTGYYKYFADSFVVYASVTVGLRFDTVTALPGSNVGGGQHFFTPTSQWAPFELMIDSISSHLPNQINCWIQLKTSDTNANPYGKLYIDSLSLHFDTPTSVHGLTREQTINVYPNPAHDHITVSWGPPVAAAEIRILDMNGRTWKTIK